MTKPTLREILVEIVDAAHASNYTNGIDIEVRIDQAIKAIKQHYLGLIGEDKPNIAVDKTSSGFILGYNAATAELRQAIEKDGDV